MKSIFPQKLWNLIHDQHLNSAIRWSDDGQSFFVYENPLRNMCLGKENNIFFTKQPKSFVRQLHLYGFKKVNKNQFKHHSFIRGKPDLLQFVKRSYKQCSPTNRNSSAKKSETTTVVSNTNTNNNANNNNNIFKVTTNNNNNNSIGLKEIQQQQQQQLQVEHSNKNDESLQSNQSIEQAVICESIEVDDWFDEHNYADISFNYYDSIFNMYNNDNSLNTFGSMTL